MIAAIPKPRMIDPEMRFTQSSPERFIRFLSRLVATLRITHQPDDPRKTPKTVIPAEEYPPLRLTKPKPAKMAAKDSIVSGLVRVRKKVEPYAFNKLFGFAWVGEFEGWEMMVLMPR
jgi:hypothetical protein